MKKMSLLALLLAFVLSFALVGCGNDAATDDTKTDEPAQGQTETPAAPAEDDKDEPNDEPAAAADGGNVVLGRSYSAPHGDKAFAQVDVAVVDDTIVAVSVDEFQFVAPDGYEGVPNADAEFAEGFAEGVTLISKMENADAYSAGMAEKAGATNTYDANMQAITDFAVGKTVAELEDALKDAAPGAPLDAISGSTLVDTVGYLTSIVDAAKAPQFKAEGSFEGAAEDLKLGYALFAAHGTKAFASTSTVLDGDKVVASIVDEFQILAPEGNEGVPSSDGGFGEGVAEGKVLASKLVNADSYSANMAEKGGATQDYETNMKAITDFAVGKTAADLEGIAGADAIAGSTFVDNVGYAHSIAEAAKAAK